MNCKEKIMIEDIESTKNVLKISISNIWLRSQKI